MAFQNAHFWWVRYNDFLDIPDIVARKSWQKVAIVTVTLTDPCFELGGNARLQNILGNKFCIKRY